MITRLLVAVQVAALVCALCPFHALAAERVDLIIRGGTVVTMDASLHVIENGAVAIKADRIVAIGSATEIAAKYTAARTINAAGKVVMPGLINTHTHVPMVLFRGIADDLVLMEWLQKYIFPAEAKNVDEQFVRWGTRLGCLEMIQGGTTTYVDMYYFEDAIADETARAGMRAVLGETVIDFPAPDNKTWDAAMAYAERFASKWKGNALVTPAIAPHAPYTVSRELFEKIGRFAIDEKIKVSIHAAESPEEDQLMRRGSGFFTTIYEKFGVDWTSPLCSSIEYLASTGILETRPLLAHCITVSDRVGCG